MNLRQALLAAALVASSGMAHATDLYSNNFETGASLSGSGTIVSTFFNKFWLNDSLVPGGMSGQSTFTFSVGPGTQSTNTTLSLWFAAIDSWDSGGSFGPDTLNVTLNGAPKFSAVFENFLNTGPTTAPGLTNVSYGSNLGGNSYNDAQYNLTVNLGTLSSGTYTVALFANGGGWQGGADESMGFDNIKVTGTVTAVPEPETYAMMLGGLGLVGFAARRRRG